MRIVRGVVGPPKAPLVADAPSYRWVRDQTEALARPLGPEDQVVQSMPDASPTKWHRAHTTWFFEEFLLGPSSAGNPVIDDYRVFDPDFRFLFNSYYEAVGERQPRPKRGMITRPDVERVAEYRHHVDAAMLALLDGDADPAVRELVVLGLHHEQQHQELLLMDAKHLLHQNPLRPAYAADADPGPGATKPVEWISHPGGVVEIGHDGRRVRLRQRGTLATRSSSNRSR